MKAINPSSGVCTISSLFDSSTNTEAKDNSSQAELLNHTFVSHFNTKQIPIQHSDIPEVNPEDSYDSIQCSEEEVYNLLCSLDTSKTTYCAHGS